MKAPCLLRVLFILIFSSVLFTFSVVKLNFSFNNFKFEKLIDNKLIKSSSFDKNKIRSSPKNYRSKQNPQEHNDQKINLGFWMKKSVHDYLISFPNYIKGEEEIQPKSKLITLATHGDIRYLDNVLQLVTRWNGPISIAVFAPGSDMVLSLRAIEALRRCYGTISDLVKKWVSFHIVTLKKDVEKSLDLEHYLQKRDNSSFLKFTENDDCKANESVFIQKKFPTVKRLLNLPYPINLLRNLARNITSTQYILFSDIELLPSLNITDYFFDLISKNSIELERKKTPYVFALFIFETWRGQVPKLKKELNERLETKEVVPFHFKTCNRCQLGTFEFELLTEWSMNTNDTTFFKTFKNHGLIRAQWEPVFIGTKDVPLNNEEIVYEGLKDRVLQLYEMCLMNYDFIILNRAFLAHKPEKAKKREWKRREEYKLQRYRIFRARQRINKNFHKRGIGINNEKNCHLVYFN